MIWVVGLWCRSSGSASRHSTGCCSNVNLAWTPAQRERVLVFDTRLYWCQWMQGGRAAEQCCSLFSCHRRECTTCSTCWVGCSWTSGFPSQRKWWGFLAPCSRPPLVSGPAHSPGSHLHRRTHREIAAADSASIWTGAVCPTSWWPGQTCTLGWKPSAGFWTCTLCHRLQKKNKRNTPARKRGIHIRYFCIWNLSRLLRMDLGDLCLIHAERLSWYAGLSSVLTTWDGHGGVGQLTAQNLQQSQSELAVAVVLRLLVPQTAVFCRDTQQSHQPQTVLSLWGRTLVYLVVSLLTRVERYQSSLPLLSPTAFHRVIRDSRGGPQTWHDGHFGPGTVRVDLDSMSLQPTAWGSQNSISASTKSPPHPERDKGPRYEEKVSTTWSKLEIIPSINQARDISDNSNINRSGSIGIVDPEDILLWRYCHKQLFSCQTRVINTTVSGTIN